MGNKQGEPLRELAGHRGRRGIEAEPSRCPESRRWIRGSRQLESLRQRNRDQENEQQRERPLPIQRVPLEHAGSH